MTVNLVTTIHRYIGLHADVKPTDAPAGSTFYETDTEDTYVWDLSSWTVAPVMASSNLTNDQYLAITGGDTPSAANVFLTRSAVPDTSATAAQLDQLDRTSGIIGGDGLGVMGVAQALFDPSAVAGVRTIAPHALGATIPANALVVGGFLHVHTLFTSAGGNAGTVAFSVESAGDIIVAAAVSGAPYSTIGRKAITPKANTPESTSILTTASRAITATVAGQALLTGKATLFLYYVQSEAQA